MATQSYEQLISGANKIRQNELPESNTAALVGKTASPNGKQTAGRKQGKGKRYY